MAFSKIRSMAPFSLSSVSIVRSVTCFISSWNFCGVSLLRILRRRLNSSLVLAISGSSSSGSGSSTPRPRVDFFPVGFQAFSALLSCTSSPWDMVSSGTSVGGAGGVTVTGMGMGSALADEGSGAGLASCSCGKKQNKR
ncbi:hypothetical protein EYF80_051778 [Liparis tanakae]|uniref:Uncharacterized protein n=1 Tax=Liparis tanakae TaxID=230148 RepID=A0A4Z2FBB9_9TELE|nr:hypothetical protein EYF80_051778 [Liparis tanakae]